MRVAPSQAQSWPFRSKHVSHPSNSGPLWCRAAQVQYDFVLIVDYLLLPLLALMLGLRLIHVDASVHADYIADCGEAGNQPRGVKRSEADSRAHGGHYTAPHGVNFLDERAQRTRRWRHRLAQPTAAGCRRVAQAGSPASPASLCAGRQHLFSTPGQGAQPHMWCVHLGPTVRLLLDKRGGYCSTARRDAALSSRMLMLIEHRTYLSGVIELTLSTSRVHAMLRSSSVMPDFIERSRCSFEF